MELERGLFDLDEQRQVRRRQRLDRRSLMVPPFTALYELSDEQGMAWSRALNDAIAAVARANPGEFVGFATVPLQSARAAAELERAAGLGLRGVEILSSVDGAGLDSPALEPFWETAERLRLPILIHPHYVAGAERLGDYYLRNLLGNPTETAHAGARLIFGGVFERHPELKVILSHGGGSLPHIIGRLQHGSEVRPECRHAQSPREQLSRLYFDTIVFDPTVLRHLVDLVGASQVVIGTDYPFDMGEERPVELVEGIGLAEAERDAILHAGDRLLAG
jgi:aminocarboxymuconate-semialdehyde decarboxylase